MFAADVGCSNELIRSLTSHTLFVSYSDVTQHWQYNGSHIDNLIDNSWSIVWALQRLPSTELSMSRPRDEVRAEGSEGTGVILTIANLCYINGVL